MSIVSFKEFLKIADGTARDVQPASPERQAIVERRRKEVSAAEAEFQRISSPVGQLKETAKAAGEITGITPTGRRIAAGIAPTVVPQEELPEVVEELVGGVTTPQKPAGRELAEIAIDLPLVSLGLSKTLAGTIQKQLPQIASGQAVNLLEKELADFLPQALQKVLHTDISTPVKTAVERGKEIVGETAQKVKTTLFGRKAQIKSIDDVVRQADESLQTTATVLGKTEELTAKPNILERWAGISPDIKNRIAGKQEKLKEYFDVAHARNNFDTLSTPLEHGAQNVEKAVSKMEALLNDTGRQIGRFRNKINTYEAGIDKIRSVENIFKNELSKLNLEIHKGKIGQIAGKVRRVVSDTETRVLNDIYGDLLIVKQNPNLEKLIDLRVLFDRKINFAKQAREVSNTIDPLSRNVRKNIADVAAQIVGKSEAGNVKKYADFIDAYEILRSFTDRKAGAEFLLKQVLSERGRAPREIIQIIKEFTGIDLMDDSVMASIATDLIGNTRQKGLFRQEITKAGLDAEAALRGDVSGAINLMFDFLRKRIISEEKQFLKAAK